MIKVFVPLQSQLFQVNVPLMLSKWTLLPSDEIQNDIHADAEKCETVESIIHFACVQNGASLAEAI